MNCKYCGSKYTELRDEKGTIEGTVYTYYCQACKSTFKNIIEHETASGEWLITLSNGDPFSPEKAEIYRKSDGSFEINQQAKGKFHLLTSAPKIYVQENSYTRMFGLWYNSYQSPNDESGTCFIIKQIEMNSQLTQAALKNDAMEALHEKSAENIFVVERQRTEELLNDATAWLRENLGIPSTASGGCYVATCVYGSYDCPEVWTLRRFRDHTLATTWYGRAFVKLYYTVSPTLVKLFGETCWFRKFWKPRLDKLVDKLQSNGVASTRYNDKKW